jgi:hypothetical protein
MFGRYPARRSQTLLATCLALIGLANAGLGASLRWLPSHSLAQAVPISPWSEINFALWTPKEDHTSVVFNHALAHDVAGPPTVAIWYQNTHTVNITRLAMFALPATPFLVLGAGFQVVALCFGALILRSRSFARRMKDVQEG